MKTAICTAILLLTLPALGAAAELVAPPSPPAVTYEVWGFRWDGQQFVQQPTYRLSTTDIKQATRFAAQITSYAGWAATTNLPAASVVHTTFRGPAIPGRPSAFPDKPIYTVWAFKQTDGKWVKDDAHCWTTTDPQQGLAYARQVGAVRGWTATDNCPATVPEAKRFVDGGTVHGAEVYNQLPFQVCDTAYGPSPRTHYRRQAIPWAGWGMNWSAYINRAIAQARANGADVSNDDYTPASTFDFTPSYTPSYDNTADIQNMINTQNMLNTQDMINTQNMVNNMQEMVNTQNMIDTQNMINAMQNNP